MACDRFDDLCVADEVVQIFVAHVGQVREANAFGVAAKHLEN